MLTRREVGIGKCYVKDNANVAREVIAELYHRRVVYNSYDLQTGKLLRTPQQICSRKQLIQWADREATAEESAKLLRDEAKDIFVSERNKRKPRDFEIESRRSRSLTESRQLIPPG